MLRHDDGFGVAGTGAGGREVERRGAQDAARA
jgi:hypothetical protein